jgi:hypothetical protein
MNRSAAKSSVSPPRRFILLPEETAVAMPHGARIRRYSLTSIARTAGGQGAGPEDALLASQVARGVGRPGAM